MVAFLTWGASPSTDGVLQQVKSMLMQGKRKEAVVLLNNTIQGIPQKNKNAIKELENKRMIIAEQFITAANFQKFQDIKAFADEELWAECLKGTTQITEPDADNLMVLRLKALCQNKSGLTEASSKTMFDILQFEHQDAFALIGLAGLALERKQFREGLLVIEPLLKVPPRLSADVERLAIIRARLLEETDHLNEAIEVLMQDQQANLKHNEVIFRLGQLYQRHTGYEWQARRAFSLFLSRCKRLSTTEIGLQHLDPMITEAQANLALLDKKLIIESGKTNPVR